MNYRGYAIQYDPPPIPSRACDWQYAADGYDGAPDGGDTRYGFASSLEDAKRQIDMLCDDAGKIPGNSLTSSG